MLDRLREAHPGMSENVPIDVSDLPAYANGQRFPSKNGPQRERFNSPSRSFARLRTANGPLVLAELVSS